MKLRHIWHQFFNEETWRCTYCGTIKFTDSQGNIKFIIVDLVNDEDLMSLDAQTTEPDCLNGVSL